MGGTIAEEFPFISSVGAEISTYAFNSFECAGVTVSAAENAEIIADNSPFGEKGLPHLSELHGAGITGRGVGIAVIDTGIYPHLDFCVPRMRITAFVDFVGGKTEPYDDNGHGTSVAGIACGSGLFYKDSAGVAPQADLIALKAVKNDGSGNVTGILTAMQWLYSNFRALKIKVVNMSLGSDSLGKNDPLALGARALISAGITVVASAGNTGPGEGTLKSPGISPSVITAGGAEKKGNVWYAAPFSSRGEDGQKKPDLIAPAVDVGTCGADGEYTRMSGTSAAAPLVSGMCALILQKRPSLSPAGVKKIIMSSLTDIKDCPHNVCGAGLFNPYES